MTFLDNKECEQEVYSCNGCTNQWKNKTFIDQSIDLEFLKKQPCSQCYMWHNTSARRRYYTISKINGEITEFLDKEFEDIYEKDISNL